MKCPYVEELECPYVDTSGMTKLKECQDCDYFKGDRELTEEELNNWNNFMRDYNGCPFSHNDT
jgi:hypothetical protein